MRGFRRRCFAAGDARELTNEGQVVHWPVQVGLSLVARYAARDAGSRHLSRELRAPSVLGRAVRQIAETALRTFEVLRIGPGHTEPPPDSPGKQPSMPTAHGGPGFR